MANGDIKARVERDVLIGTTAAGVAMFGAAICMAAVQKPGTATRLLKMASAIVEAGSPKPGRE
jgi:cyanophycinase-like exopeptidase